MIQPVETDLSEFDDEIRQQGTDFAKPTKCTARAARGQKSKFACGLGICSLARALFFFLVRAKFGADFL